MIRWMAVGAAVVGLAVIVVVQLDGWVEIVTWEALMVSAVIFLARGRWPTSPHPSRGLFGYPPDDLGRRPHSLAGIELEVAGATDEALGGATRLRRRLRRLLEHRTGRGSDPADTTTGRHLFGAEAWTVLTGTDDVVDLDRVAEVVARLEDL